MHYNSEWYKRYKKIEKIEQRALTMRARSPPRSLLHSTSRRNITEEQVNMAGAPSPTKFGDQLIQRGILTADGYDRMRRTLQKELPSGTLASSLHRQQTHHDTHYSDIAARQLHSAHSSTRPFPFTSTLESTSPSRGSPKLGSTRSNQREDDYEQFDHPLVHELCQRALTSAAGKRRMQATVKNEVEAHLSELPFEYSSSPF